MLGWFKKKRKKSIEEVAQPVTENRVDAVEPATITSPEVEPLGSETSISSLSHTTVEDTHDTQTKEISETDFSSHIDTDPSVTSKDQVEQEEPRGSYLQFERYSKTPEEEPVEAEEDKETTEADSDEIVETIHSPEEIPDTVPTIETTGPELSVELPETIEPDHSEIEEVAQPQEKSQEEVQEKAPVLSPQFDADDSPQEDISQPEPDPPAVAGEKTETKRKSLFSRLTERLGKTRESFTYQMDALFLGKKEIDGALLDDLEEIMITADLGVETTEELIESARRKVKRKELSSPASLKENLKDQIKEYIIANEEDATLVMPASGPFVIMVIGVNGVGKTTTIGKIANKFLKADSSVLLVAGDTFRAAAVSQLQIWGERNNVPVIAHKEGADPSSVVFDALGIAQEKDIDVVLVDTAGRMHTKDNLMEELKKIKRVMGKKLPGAPHEVMLVIDATTGQNAISQARLFDDAVGVTGLTLTKLDGTSKGGIVANICREMKIPIRFIGIGEQMDDLRDFDAGEFVDALFQGEKISTH